MEESARDVANVNVVSLEMRLEQHDETVVDSAIDEIVDQKIDPHARRHAEHSGKPQADGAVSRQNDFLGFDLIDAVERYRPKRRFLGAKLARLADAVTAIGDRHDDALLWRHHLAQRGNGVTIRRRRGD